VKSYKWAVLGAMAILLAGVPASAAKGKMIVVDSETALVYPLEDGRLVREPIISNNRKEFVWKDIGTFRITEKIIDKRSNLYNTDGDPIRPGEKGAQMRYWMRMGWTAQGFHQSALFSPELPRRRSHGCYRLSKSSAEWLFNWTPVGTPVHVVRRLKDSRFAGLAKQQPITMAQRGSGANATPRTPAKPAQAAAAAKTSGRAVTKAAVTVKPAPRPVATTARVTIKRVDSRSS